MKNLEKKLEGKVKEKYSLRRDPANNLTGIYRAREKRSWPIGEYNSTLNTDKSLAKACATVARYVAEKKPNLLKDESIRYSVLNEEGEVLFEGNYNDLLEKCNVEGLENYAEVPVRIVEKYGDIVLSRKKITEEETKE